MTLKCMTRPLLLQLGLFAILPGIVWAQTPTPHLFFSDLVNGPNSGGQGNNGAFVTLYGNYFGSNPTVTVGGGQAIVTMPPSSYLWYQKMTIQLGALAQTGNIVVSNSNGTSNGLPFAVNSSSIYFVATTGSDSAAGSYTAPWKTLLHAVQTTGAGSIIYGMTGVSQTADDGTGWDTSMLLRQTWCQGTAASPKALIAYPGATVTVGTTGTSPSYGIRATDSSGGACGGNWVIAGLTLRGIQPIQTAGPSTNWRIIGNDVSNPQASGNNGGGSALGVEQSTYTEVLGNNGHDMNLASTDRLQQAFYPGTDSNYLELAWNMIENAKGRAGIQIHSSPLSSGNGYVMYSISIHDNVVHDIAEEGIIVDTVDPSKGPVTVYNNVVYNTGQDGQSDGAIYRADSSDYDTSQGVGSGYVDFYNNTIFAYTTAGPGFGDSFEVAQGQALIDRLRNNIILSSGGDYFDVTNSTNNEGCATTSSASACPNFTGSNNLLYGNGAATFPNVITGSINANPLLVSPSTGDAQLQAGSPAIGAGVFISGLTADIEGELRPQSGAPDIGAYQYGSASALPTPTPTPLPPPTLISPANGATGVSLAPALSWSAASGATSYDVYFGTSFSPPLAANTTGTSYAPGTLAAGIPYYWQVVAKNNSGSNASATWSFTTQVPAPAAPALSAPANGATGVSLTPALTWNASTGAASYNVYFGTSSPPPFVASTTGTSYAPEPLSQDTNYYWQIVALNSFGSTASDTWSFTAAAPSAGLLFVPVAPCRIADTRNSAGPFGGPAMSAGSTRSFAIPQSACGIPSAAEAYSLNVTVVPAGPLAYLTMWPTGQTQPFVSTLNSSGGSVVANAALVPAGSGGAVSAYVSDATDVILDINGYFDTAAGATSYSFYPAPPCRIADTRNPTGQFGGPSMSAGQTRDFPIPLGSCAIPSTVTAYSLNVTAVPDTNSLGYLTTWPTGSPLPLVSTLNSQTGKVVANAAIVPAGTNESISVFVTDPTDVVLDFDGYFGQPGSAGALTFYPLAPCRVADTRNAAGPFGGPEMGAQSTRSFAIPASGCNIPATAAAYSLNVTVVPDGLLAYLTAWPTGSAQPYVSTLNSSDGSVVANAAIVPAGANGAISIYVTDSTQVILDINGYFAP